jgi:acyl-CoA dehydrogenase
VTFWSPEQETLRDSARTFVRREVLPHLQRWEDERAIPRELHRAAAEQGFLGVAFPEEVGGGATEVLDDLAAKLLGFTR